MKRTLQKLKRLLDFAKLVWTCYPWDDSYLIKSTIISLNHMADVQGSDPYKAEDTDDNVRLMRLISKSMDRFLDDEPVLKALKSVPASVEEKICEFKTEPVLDSSGKETGYYRSRLDPEYDDARKAHFALRAVDEQVKQRRLRWAFKAIGQNIEKWWT